MTYPYIGKSTYGLNCFSVAVFCSNNFGALLENNVDSNTLCEFGSDFNDRKFKNITAEYLANTYGEVKNKEHAHFIVKLGEGAGYELCGSVSPNDAGVFVFDGENKTLFFMLGGGNLRGGSVLKQITIPLPPECESVDEWPKVGDDAVVINKNDYTLIYGHEVVGENVKVLTTYSTNNISMAVVEFDGCGYCFKVDMLEKPKTPEQELRDEVISYFRKIGQNGIVLIGRYDEVADDFLSKYNITKKGEGDE